MKLEELIKHGDEAIEKDDWDATYIGLSCICFANGYNQKDKESDRLPALEKTRAVMSWLKPLDKDGEM